ncbi:MAG: hypothetical protein WKF57_03880 [Nakamurella sp.]
MTMSDHTPTVEPFDGPTLVFSFVEVSPIGRWGSACPSAGPCPRHCTHNVPMGAGHEAHLISSEKITAADALELGNHTLVGRGDSMSLLTVNVAKEGAGPFNTLEALAPFGPDLKVWTPALRRMVVDALGRSDVKSAQLSARVIELAAKQSGIVYRRQVQSVLGLGQDGTHTAFARTSNELIGKLKRAGLMSESMPPLLNPSIGPGRTAYYSLPRGSY